MLLSRRLCFLFLCAVSSIVAVEQTEDLTINLKEPIFSQGVISTDQGGVIEAPGIRIQARKISYTSKVENGIPQQKVVAEGDLLLEYLGQYFIGEKLEYDFVTHTGSVLNGKTYTSIWFLGGDKFELRQDGSFVIYNAYLTTSESQNKTFNVDASKIKISKEKMLTADNISFKFFKVPFFWVPKFKSNLKFFSSPPIRYKVVWDKSLGPRPSARFRVFSSKYSDLYLRFDYRISKGPGAAVESEFYSEDNLTTFLTRNYGAMDKSVPDEHGRYRYRLQGMFHSQSKDASTVADLTWDKLSDDKMPGDFKNDDFEINTQLITLFRLNHIGDDYAGTLRVQPRINKFQSLTQQLPLANVSLRPLTLASSGIISENFFNGGYLNYSYASKVNNVLHNFHAGRIETKNYLYRPIDIHNFTLTPFAGFTGIYYSNNPQHRTVVQALGIYGATANTRISRRYSHYRHLIEPYIQFQGLTNPTIKVDRYYVFNIDDGYTHINMVKLGARQSFFSQRTMNFSPTMVLDVFAYGFFNEKDYHTTFPRGYTNFDWNLPNLNFRASFCWNIAEKLLDYSNFYAFWTANEDFAVGIEYRHRSRFDWRKSNHDNYVIDFARPLDELLHSPISDGRNTFLARAEMRVSPRWSIHYQAHIGWGRRNEPNYDSQRVDLITYLSTHWKARISYEHMPNDDRFTYDIKIVK